MSIVGKFFCHLGPEYMHTGKVVAMVDPASVLIEIDHCAATDCVVPKTMKVMSLAPMTSRLAKDGSIDGEWEFFSTRDDLDAWLEWLETPTDPDEAAEKPSPSLN